MHIHMEAVRFLSVMWDLKSQASKGAFKALILRDYLLSLSEKCVWELSLLFTKSLLCIRYIFIFLKICILRTLPKEFACVCSQ